MLSGMIMLAGSLLLDSIGQDIAVRAGTRLQIRVIVPPEWSDGVVNVKIYPDGDRATILISPIILAEMDPESIRAILAHEIGHTQNHCRPDLPNATYSSVTKELACEGAADAFAARIVGRRAVLRSLCQITYLSFDYRYITDSSVLFARIRKLHYRTDIP